LQQTSWQRNCFEKEPRFPFEVPRTAAETDTPSLLDRQWCWWCDFQSRRPVWSFGRLPGTRRFNGHRIKHMGPGYFSYYWFELRCC